VYNLRIIVYIIKLEVCFKISKIAYLIVLILFKILFFKILRSYE